MKPDKLLGCYLKPRTKRGKSYYGSMPRIVAVKVLEFSYLCLIELDDDAEYEGHSGFLKTDIKNDNVMTIPFYVPPAGNQKRTNYWCIFQWEVVNAFDIVDTTVKDNGDFVVNL